MLRPLLLAAGLSTAVSPNYYIDSRTGVDTNAGTSADQPWRSLSRLTSALPLSPGEQVKLARGGVWREGLTIAGGGNATGPVVYTSYGSASDEKPLLLGSVAVGAAGNWSAVPGAPGQWRTFQKQLVPAPGAVQLLHNADFADGSAFWGLWNENPEGNAHVSGSVNSTVVPPAAAGAASKSFRLTFREMAAAPQSYTQLYAMNVSVVAGQSYVSSRLQATCRCLPV
jgi:hypothetical protein